MITGRLCYCFVECTIYAVSSKLLGVVGEKNIVVTYKDKTCKYSLFALYYQKKEK